MIYTGILLFALAGSPFTQEISPPLSQSFQARSQIQQDSEYQKGLHALDARQWDEAISAFTASAARKGASADGALYWKAYAENREDRDQEALATLRQLRQSYPDSRWLHDAQALALEIRTQAGPPVDPSTEPDDSLKLIALNSLMQSEPDKALPILKKLLACNNSEKLKEWALFVLTQNRTPEARQLLASIARGTTDPSLQVKAIRYMGMMGGDAGRTDLEQIYSSSSDERVRKAILQSMFLSHDSEWLDQIARTEKDPALRVDAIRTLGLMKGVDTAGTLVSIYKTDTNPKVREAVLNALFLQHNGKALVDLARAEKDPEMKNKIVERMALIHTKETTDYMMEVLQ